MEEGWTLLEVSSVGGQAVNAFGCLLREFDAVFSQVRPGTFDTARRIPIVETGVAKVAHLIDYSITEL